jgi:hypothetical protein
MFLIGRDIQDTDTQKQALLVWPPFWPPRELALKAAVYLLSSIICLPMQIWLASRFMHRFSQAWIKIT